MGNLVDCTKDPVTSQKQHEYLTIATLNYCGILSSPFEFYSQENQQEQARISQIFRQLIPQYVPAFNEQKFQWKMGKIGKDIQKGRFSLMFDPSAGSNGQRFLNRTEFQTRWGADFLKLTSGMAQGERKWGEEEVRNSRLFDLVFYHSLLVYVFGSSSFEEAITHDPISFRSKIEHFYHQIFLDQEQKLSNFRKGFVKLRPDVFFIQEYSERLLEAIRKEKQLEVVVDARGDSLIIVNQLSFKDFRDFNFLVDQIEERPVREELWKWGKGLATVVADDYVFICVHLSSKKEVNPVQLEELKTHLLLLKKHLPKYHIVLGGDLNSYLSPDEAFSSKFHLFPRNEEVFTTLKKRTFTQAQFHKAEVQVKESKDRIITTEPIEHGEVAYMGGEGKVDAHAFLPSNAHPYDHLLCVTTLRRHRSLP